ncbi:MAG: DUF262 domain-containing protein [Deltaproteobacteria bacterium]|nr:DUF262 domain-containing protein [Deltaproteobacteria bacterium]
MSEKAQVQIEEPEGQDSSQSSGWGDYPLDSVFVRTESRTVREVVSRIKKGRYILDPDYQRDFVWELEKQSRLIESCLMRIPLPVFYVAEAKDGKIMVVDGLQRLTTFYRYTNDKFVLTWPVPEEDKNARKVFLIGKKFSDLPLKLQERIEDVQLILYILDEKAPERVKLDIFERVNGGVPLTRQQMRNCLHNGQATQWLKKTAQSEIFLRVTDGRLDTKSMRDREVINRFCAFYLLGPEEYKGDMDGFLAQALDKMNGMGADELNQLTLAFDRSMQSNERLFDKHAFRKSLATGNKGADRTMINIAFFDICSAELARLSRERVEEKADDLRSVISNLLNNKDFSNAITFATNGAKQVKLRFDMMQKAIAEVA